VLPFSAHPFGKTHRPVSRLVTSITTV